MRKYSDIEVIFYFERDKFHSENIVFCNHICIRLEYVIKIYNMIKVLYFQFEKSSIKAINEFKYPSLRLIKFQITLIDSLRFLIYQISFIFHYLTDIKLKFDCNEV